MPTRAGVSHALSAVLVLLLTPFIEKFVEALLERHDPIPALEAAARTISSHPTVHYPQDTVKMLVYFGTVALITFIWGFAYHLNRHGFRD